MISDNGSDGGLIKMKFINIYNQHHRQQKIKRLNNF